jgi:hypothetical protein
MVAAAHRAARSSYILFRLNIRTARVSCYSFNFNVYADATALRDFRFCVNDLTSRIIDFAGWGGRIRTCRNRYRCDAITAT